ncbi:MAG TPA: hypothetical protein VMT80_00225 [Candidatus Paceibacterota bacterium]|nr:hypothetical protein [Candidatus Paceibacterota bacterium]
MLLNTLLFASCVLYVMWLLYTQMEATERRSDAEQAHARTLAEMFQAFRVERARTCIAQVIVVEGANLTQVRQRVIGDVVVNRSRAWGNPDAWLDNICAFAYATHYNKQAGIRMFEFSGFRRYGLDYDFPTIPGWQKAYETAYQTVVTALDPAYGRQKYGYEPLDPRYVYYITAPADMLTFEGGNGVVCDDIYPFEPTAKSGMTFLEVCRPTHEG